MHQPSASWDITSWKVRGRSPASLNSHAAASVARTEAPASGLPAVRSSRASTSRWVTRCPVSRRDAARASAEQPPTASPRASFRGFAFTGFLAAGGGGGPPARSAAGRGLAAFAGGRAGGRGGGPPPVNPAGAGPPAGGGGGGGPPARSPPGTGFFGFARLRLPRTTPTPTGRPPRRRSPAPPPCAGSRTPL